MSDAAADALVAFDTSTECMALAVRAGDTRCCEAGPGGAAASATLLPALQRLLAAAGRRMPQVAAIAFGRGPGAFTGLRTSCAVAQGLAFGLGRPVLPIDSLLIVAEQARGQAAPTADLFDVSVVMDARMGELYAARYRWQGVAAEWQVVQAPGLWAPDALVQAWADAPRAACAGSGLALMGATWLAGHQPVDVTPEGRAPALLALAERAWHRGAGVDAAQALPIYLRDKVALTTAERAAAAAARAA